MLIAISIPNLDNLIPLVGVTAGMLIAFILPPAVDTIVFLPIMLEEYKKTRSPWKIIGKMLQNFCLAGVGVFGLVAGLQSTIKDLIN